VNSFFGASAGQSNVGIFNSFFGAYSGSNNTSGHHNTFVGTMAGVYNVSGNSNIFIGSGAGPELGSNPVSDRLFIDNVTSNEPLIYAEFDNDFVKINGTFEVTAGLSNPSSRSLKKSFIALDAFAILEKVAQLPIEQWSYKDQSTVRHIGPVAEDFYDAFGVGCDGSISTIDASGVALVAIKALKAENEKLRLRQDELMREIIKLAEIVAAKSKD
jgi:hypothetical protein